MIIINRYAILIPIKIYYYIDVYIIRAEPTQYDVPEFDKSIRILLAPDLFVAPTIFVLAPVKNIPVCIVIENEKICIGPMCKYTYFSQKILMSKIN